jgi:hypothetical protein
VIVDKTPSRGVMSDNDKTIATITIISVIAVFGLLYMILGMGFYTEYECVQFYTTKLSPLPPVCSNSDLAKTLLEFAALIVGVLAALKVFMGKM